MNPNSNASNSNLRYICMYVCSTRKCVESLIVWDPSTLWSFSTISSPCQNGKLLYLMLLPLRRPLYQSRSDRSTGLTKSMATEVQRQVGNSLDQSDEPLNEPMILRDKLLFHSIPNRTWATSSKSIRLETFFFLNRSDHGLLTLNVYEVDAGK